MRIDTLPRQDAPLPEKLGVHTSLPNKTAIPNRVILRSQAPTSEGWVNVTCPYRFYQRIEYFAAQKKTVVVVRPEDGSEMQVYVFQPDIP